VDKPRRPSLHPVLAMAALAAMAGRGRRPAAADFRIVGVDPAVLRGDISIFVGGVKVAEGVLSHSRPLPPPDPEAQARALAIAPVATRAQRRERAWLARVREAERGEGEPRG